MIWEKKSENIFCFLANWCRFDKLSNALAGESVAAAILSILQNLKFPIDDDSTSSILIGCCDNDGKVDVSKFLGLIDWRNALNIDQFEISDDAIGQLNAAREASSTTNQMYDSEINKIQTQNWHRFGAPSVRTDLPPPRVRRVDDTKNYGDEGNAGLLISPSICETFGVYQSDIYQRRPMAEIRELYSKMGIEIDDAKLETLWNEIAGKKIKKKISKKKK